MLHLSDSEPTVPPPATALILSDRLIALAEDAERAGLRATATRLVRLACTVLDESRRPAHARVRRVEYAGQNAPH
jgi:hypothetical protein